MSVFTNPASRAPEQARQYIDAILELLGDEDPIEVLRKTADAIREIADSLSPDQIRQHEAPGKWSANEVLQHLADAELVWGYRVRMILAQDRPPLTGYDQDLWASRLHYRDADPVAAIARFRLVRLSNLALVGGASEADLARVGVHAERGEESVAHVIRLNAGHDLLHIRQLERIRAAVTGA
jgi:hypothetical protein